MVMKFLRPSITRHLALIEQDNTPSPLPPPFRMTGTSRHTVSWPSLSDFGRFITGSTSTIHE